MTKRDLLAVVLRIVGVVTLLRALYSTSWCIGLFVAAFFSEYHDFDRAVPGVVVVLLYLAAGLVLTLRAEKLSGAVFRRDGELPFLQTEGRESALLAVGLAAAGLFIAAQALPNFFAGALAAGLPDRLAPQEWGIEPFLFTQSFPVIAAIPLCGIAGGICLALYATRLADWAFGVRVARREPEEEAEGDE